MGKKTLSELPDGTSTITSDAVAAFEQDGTTSKTSILVNPENVIAVENQAQLEAKLGVNLEIPDNEVRAIHYLKSFTQTKPFLLGVNSSLQLLQATSNLTITYTGAGGYIQMTTPGTSGARLFIRGFFTIAGNGTNSILDAKFADDVTIETFIASNLQDFGIIDCPFVNFTSMILTGLTTGIVIKDANVFEGRILNIIQTSAVGITGLSVIGTTPTVANIQQLNGTLFVGDTLLFLDPNTTGRSVVFNSNLNLGDFFQQGTDITINSVADNGSGNARFTTAVSHGLVVGKPVVLSAFATETTYNGTFIVTAVDTPLTGITFDVKQIFTATDTGNLNAASLDNTDIIVSATDNIGSPDSMIIAESRINGVLEVDGSGGVDVSIVDITPVAGDWIQDPSTERFSVDTTTGLITYNGMNTVTVMIKYSLSASQTSGAAQDLDIDLHINGIVQTKSRTQITTAGVGSLVAAVYNGGNFIISTGDTFQLFKNNTTNTNNTNISNATILINLD